MIPGANLRALTGGVTTDKIFAFVKELRKDVTVPMVFMTYANVIFSYGAGRFLSACQDIGIDGLILSDLPFEEKDEFLPVCREYGVDPVSYTHLDVYKRQDLSRLGRNYLDCGLYLEVFFPEHNVRYLSLIHI